MILPETEGVAVGADQIGADIVGGVVGQRQIGHDAGVAGADDKLVIVCLNRDELAPVATSQGAGKSAAMVIVTLMTPVWPGLITTGEKEAAAAVGLIANSQKSPVGLVTAGSKGLAAAVIDMFTNPEGAGPENGPNLAGSATQRPGVTVPPLGVYDPAALSAVIGGARRSGSPLAGPKSNSIGNVAVKRPGHHRQRQFVRRRPNRQRAAIRSTNRRRAGRHSLQLHDRARARRCHDSRRHGAFLSVNAVSVRVAVGRDGRLTVVSRGPLAELSLSFGGKNPPIFEGCRSVSKVVRSGHSHGGYAGRSIWRSTIPPAKKAFSFRPRKTFSRRLPESFLK